MVTHRDYDDFTLTSILLFAGSLVLAWGVVQLYVWLLARRYPSASPFDTLGNAAVAAAVLGGLALAFATVSIDEKGSSPVSVAIAVAGAVLLAACPLVAVVRRRPR